MDPRADGGAQGSDSPPPLLPPLSASSFSPPSPPVGTAGLHARTLSDSHIEPIRSLTGLVLSPTRAVRGQSLSQAQQQQQPEQQSGPAAGEVAAQLLQQILERTDGIHRYCESIVQMQAQQAEQIGLLEAAIRLHSGGGGGTPQTAAAGAAAHGAQALRTPASGLPGGVPGAPGRAGRPHSLSVAVRWTGSPADPATGVPFPQHDVSPHSQSPRVSAVAAAPHQLNRSQTARDPPFDAATASPHRQPPPPHLYAVARPPAFLAQTRSPPAAAARAPPQPYSPHAQPPMSAYAPSGFVPQLALQRAVAAAPHGPSASAFGYSVSAGASGPQAEPPQQARAKRPRGADGGDEFPAGSPRARASSFVHVHPHQHQLPHQHQMSHQHQLSHQPHYHLQPAYTLLPPIRAAAATAQDKGKAPAVPPRSGEGPARRQPAAQQQQQQPQQQQPQQQQAEALVPATRSGNPDAQPTQAWLSGQRQYKTALLHLLTLESFYPSDVAMLNVFRAQGDFSSEQIESSGAAMLSWARSWLRYNRNAVIRSTLDSKAKATPLQLAEALQHDLHAETDFTTPLNLRRCVLLRLIFYQWQAENKLGTKSQSLYRDYETRLREIEALATVHEQEAEWDSIRCEEQARRLALIREGRGSGSSTILPRPEHQLLYHQPLQQQQQQERSVVQSPGVHHGWTVSEHATPMPLPVPPPRRQSMDWQPQYRPHPLPEAGPAGRDDDSDMSVKFTPEPPAQ